MTAFITTLQILITLAYVLFVVHRYGVLTSISASTYEFTGRERWYFLVWLWSVALLNVLQPMDLFGFWATAGIAFTGITIDHAEDVAHADKIHYISVVFAIIMTFVGFMVLYGMYLPTILLAVGSGAIYMITKRYFIWWFEVWAFALVFGTYYFI